LDVGSGLVLPEVNRLRKLGAQWVGVEIDPEVCRLLASDGVQTYAGTLEDFARTNPEPFDYLVLSQVLEHIYHPQSFLSTARSLLRAGGKIVLSCPNFDSFLRKRYGELWLGWHVPYHVTHYNRQTLDRLAQATGFRISRLLTVTPSNWFQAQRQMAKGLKFRPDFLAKNRSLQRLLDIYLATRHLSLLGDAILAELEIIS
jgi:2-polyprenyl-3-methyl-5-hydroxy-6-metoxy-1,4-benzoquinol methylase